MNSHNYDRNLAEKLVPLLSSITKEIRERNAAIDALEKSIDAPARPSDHDDNRQPLGLRLVEHRRALRDAERELVLLGCMLDEDHPLRVLIPGGSGEFEGGFAFDALSGEFEAMPGSSAR